VKLLQHTIFIILLIFSTQVFAQTDNRFVVNKDVDALLSERSKCATEHKTAVKLYHIQLYNGQNMARARSVKSDFLLLFSDTSAQIKWEAPEFKVWVGNYENKLSVDRALIAIKKKFPNAFVVNPKK